MFEFSALQQPDYVATINWPSMTTSDRGNVLKYLNYQVQTESRFGSPAWGGGIPDNTPLWKEYWAGAGWTSVNDQEAYQAGRYSGYSVSYKAAFAQAVSHVPYAGSSLAAVVMGAPILPVLAVEAITAYAITTLGDQAIAKLTAPAATQAAAAAEAGTVIPAAETLTTGAATMAEPTIYEQFSGIIKEGAVAALTNTVTRAISPAPTAPQYGQAGYAGYVSQGNTQGLNIPVWGWLIAGAAVAVMLIVSIKAVK